MALFLEDWWLANKIATLPSDEYPQNYYHLDDNSTLLDVLEDFSTCLHGTGTAFPPVTFDGWEIADTPNAYGWFWDRVIWASGLGLYIASASYGMDGAPGMIMTSPDGYVWTLRTTPYGDGLQLGSLSYSPELGIVVAGVKGTSANIDDATIIYSTDGLNWTAYRFPDPLVGTPSIGEICWSSDKGRFVSVGDVYDQIYYSTNGTSWTEASSYSYDLKVAVAYSPTLELFCAVGYYDVCAVSSDGVTWEHGTMPAGFYSDVVWSESAGKFIAYGDRDSDSSTAFAASSDGLNWTSYDYDIPFSSSSGSDAQVGAYSISYDEFNDVIRIVGRSDHWGSYFVTPSFYVATSTDGETWTIDTTVPGTHSYDYGVLQNGGWRDVAYKSATERVLLGIYKVAVYTGGAA